MIELSHLPRSASAAADYDFDLMFNGKIHGCMEGIDFKVTPNAFANSVRKEANDRKLRVTVQAIRNEEKEFTGWAVQSFGPGEPRRRRKAGEVTTRIDETIKTKAKAQA